MVGIRVDEYFISIMGIFINLIIFFWFFINFVNVGFSNVFIIVIDINGWVLKDLVYENVNKSGRK